MDGSSELRTFTTIVVPMIKPGIGALAIFTFINSWNDYFMQLIMLSSGSNFTISLGIATLQAETSVDMGMLMAGCGLGRNSDHCCLFGIPKILYPGNYYGRRQRLNIMRRGCFLAQPFCRHKERSAMSKIEKFQGVIPAFYACYDDAGNISPERVRALAPPSA